MKRQVLTFEIGDIASMLVDMIPATPRNKIIKYATGEDLPADTQPQKVDLRLDKSQIQITVDSESFAEEQNPPEVAAKIMDTTGTGTGVEIQP